MGKVMRKCGKEKKEVGGRFSREMRRDAIFAYRPIARRSFTCFCHCFFRSGPSPFLDGNSFDFTPWSDWLLPVCLLVRCIDHKQLDSALTWDPYQPACTFTCIQPAFHSTLHTNQPASQQKTTVATSLSYPHHHSTACFPIPLPSLSLRCCCSSLNLSSLLLAKTGKKGGRL